MYHIYFCVLLSIYQVEESYHFLLNYLDDTYLPFIMNFMHEMPGLNRSGAWNLNIVYPDPETISGKVNSRVITLATKVALGVCGVE